MLELFDELINIITQNKHALKDYVLKYFAHLVQKPTENPNVSLIITGEKGVGKDTLVDLLGVYVIGKVYFHNYQSNHQFFDKYDTNRKYKFLVKLEEADRKYFLEDASLLKSLITARNNTFNPKGMPSFDCENFIRYIFTTNKANCADMKGGERRFVICPCSSQRKGDFKFWDEVYSILYTNEAGRIIADYLLSFNLDDYNPRKQPENDVQDSVVESEKNELDLFIEQLDSNEYTPTELFTKYRDFCIEKELFYVKTTIGFGKKLLNYVVRGSISKRKSSGEWLYKKV